MKKLATAFCVIGLALNTLALDYDSGSWSFPMTATLSGTFAMNRTAVFTSGIDSGVFLNWDDIDTGASGVAVGFMGDMTVVGTDSGIGHTIPVLGLNRGGSYGTKQHQIGVEGRVNGVSQDSSWAGYGVLGLGTWDSAVSTGTTGIVIGVRARSEVTNGDANTARSTGTAVGLFIDDTKGGATHMGLWQTSGDDYNVIAGSTQFSSSLTTPPVARVQVVQPGGAAVTAALGIYSGGASDYTYMSMGRAAVDYYLGVSAGVDQFLTGNVAGDAFIGTGSTSNRLAFSSGLNAVPEFTVANDTVTINSSNFQLPTHATPRASVTPARNGQLIFNSTGLEVCLSTGTVNTSWVKIHAPTTACAN